jgi:P pilus assembly chaperone PapD
MHRYLRLLLILLGTGSLFLVTSSYAGGIIIGRTRVIYQSSEKEAELEITNNSRERPYLIQSWIDTGDVKTRGPFIITPPLFRLNAQQENALRIELVDEEAVSKDRESMFYVNIRSIPSTSSEAGNRLKLVVKTRIKLFYRPDSLKGRAEDAFKALQFKHKEAGLVISNPSSFYVVFGALSVSGHTLKEPEFIPPHGDVTVSLPEGNPADSVKWSAINDYGGDTVLLQRQL